MEERNIPRRHDTRKEVDEIIKRVNDQKMNNISVILEKQEEIEELEYNLSRLKSHTTCPMTSELNCKNNEKVIETTKEIKEEQHADDCHCSKCCPNPTPTFFQKNKMYILMGFLWLAMFVLAIGWTPSGETFEAIQESYVELIVDCFKMLILVIASFVSFKIVKKGK